MHHDAAGIRHSAGGTKNRYLSGKRLECSRADTYPPGFSFPGPVNLFSPGEEGRGRAATTTQRHDGVAQRPRATITPREIWLIRSGNYPPLSDHTPGVRR